MVPIICMILKVVSIGSDGAMQEEHTVTLGNQENVKEQ